MTGCRNYFLCHKHCFTHTAMTSFRKTARLTGCCYRCICHYRMSGCFDHLLITVPTNLTGICSDSCRGTGWVCCDLRHIIMCTFYLHDTCHSITVIICIFHSNCLYHIYPAFIQIKTFPVQTILFRCYNRFSTLNIIVYLRPVKATYHLYIILIASINCHNLRIICLPCNLWQCSRCIPRRTAVQRTYRQIIFPVAFFLMTVFRILAACIIILIVSQKIIIIKTTALIIPGTIHIIPGIIQSYLVPFMIITGYCYRINPGAIAHHFKCLCISGANRLICT